MKTKKPRVLVIGTGGEISAKPSKGIWKYGEINPEKIIKMIPGIEDHFEISTTNLFRMDSSDIKPENWLTLANTIYYNMQKYDGIVVTMGTDTLHYADTAISFLIQNNNIPIVFTGSKVDPTHLNTDAFTNLSNAITLAGTSDLAETVVVFNGHIFRATRTKKVNASEFDAFDTTENAVLGKIEEFITLNPPYKKRGKRKPVLHNKLEMDVAIHKVYPGFDGNRLKMLVDYGAKGIVLEGYGLGNLPLIDNSLKDAIKYAAKKNVILVVTSDCFLGKYWKSIYKKEIGSRLKGLKIIHAYDMLTETAYIKLMWVLAKTRKYEEVKKMMYTNYAGEINRL